MKKVYLLLVFLFAVQLMAQQNNILIKGIALETTLFKTDSLYEIILKVTNSNTNGSAPSVYWDTCHKASVSSNICTLNLGTVSCSMPYTPQNSTIAYLIKLNAGESFIISYKFLNSGIISKIDLNLDFIRFPNKRKDIFAKKTTYKLKGDFWGKRKYEGSVLYIHHSINT